MLIVTMPSGPRREENFHVDVADSAREPRYSPLWGARRQIPLAIV